MIAAATGDPTQTGDGHDMDHYAADLAGPHLADLKNAIHVGHSTGGGEVTHYLGHSRSRDYRQVSLTSASIHH